MNGTTVDMGSACILSSVQPFRLQSHFNDRRPIPFSIDALLEQDSFPVHIIQALPSTHQSTAGDDAVHLVGPLVNLRQLGVAHQFFHQVTLDIAIAAVDLNGVGGDPHGRIGGK